MQCSACNQSLVPVFPDDQTDYQFDNALWIGFFGGYGMFVEGAGYIDSADKRKVIEESSYEAVICHDCAHKLCEENPWISSLIRPLKSHSHTLEYWGTNPEHEGWDKKNNQ